MKLSSEAVLEIVAIVQDGILGVKDASQALRDLDLVATDVAGILCLSAEYKLNHARAGAWVDEAGEA